ncbi:hypothetical protein BDR03DRAFT_987511 [Suillus americanus]|nr:hypothetical protein BDR03DRAFT_987511 [Suillus americanus]
MLLRQPANSVNCGCQCHLAASSSNLSDAEDNDVPLTPHFKQSSGALYVANPSQSAQAGVGLPTPSYSPEIKNTAFYPHPMISSFEDQHYFDRFQSRPVNDKHSLEDISQKVQDIYFSHIERLSVQSFQYAVHYKEAVCERRRMHWYIQWLHTLVHSLCDNSEAELMMADQESRCLSSSSESLKSWRINWLFVFDTNSREKVALGQGQQTTEDSVGIVQPVNSIRETAVLRVGRNVIVQRTWFVQIWLQTLQHQAPQTSSNDQYWNQHQRILAVQYAPIFAPHKLLGPMSMARGLCGNDSGSLAVSQHHGNPDSERQQNNQIDVEMESNSGTVMSDDFDSAILTIPIVLGCHQLKQPHYLPNPEFNVFF